MGHHELLEALRHEGDEKSAAIHRKTEEEMERMRETATAAREELRAEHARQQESLCAARRRKILVAAEREAQLVLLNAEHLMAKRLYDRARLCLGQMRREGYDHLFRGLATEAAEIEGAEVRVNPADRELAARHFPRSTITADHAITGGFEAATADNNLTVINTLERRLERAWPDLLPHIAAGFREQPP